MREEKRMSNEIKVLVVDDDNLVAMSLKTILEADGGIDVVGLGNDGKDAVRLYKEFRPDVLLMDIQMKDMSGLEASELIIGEDKEAKILLLTTFSDNEYIVKALNIGTKGYILKQDFESIIPSVKAVYNGQSVFGGEVVAKLPAIYSESSDNGGGSESSGNIQATEESGAGLGEYDLTDKEIDVIKLVAEGMNNKEISEELYLSEGTVRNYISVILEKLQLRDRTQLAIFYLKRGI